MLLAFALGFLMPAQQLQAQTIWNGTADISWYDATESSFDISTPEQLAGVAQLMTNQTTNFEGKTLNLTDDIWLNATGDSTNNWTPIGGYASATGEDTYSSSPYAFRGTFKGNGHVIYNMYCNKPSYFQAGLFGCVSNPCLIDSLVMINPVVKAAGMSGALVGYTQDNGDVHISNCLFINARVEATTGNNNGGILGGNWKMQNGTHWTYITNCGYTGHVSGKYLGGIAGNGQRVYATNVYFAGTMNPVTSDQLAYGGILGHADDNKFNLTNCYSNVTATTYSKGRDGVLMSSTDMQIIDFVNTLGDAFMMDAGTNNGYPILSYMAGVSGTEYEICLGESVVLSAHGYESYSWSTGETTEDITVQPTTTTTYTLIGTTSSGSTVTHNIVVTVHPQAEITAIAMPSPGGVTHGTVTPETSYVACGSTDDVTLTITPDENWHIALITMNDSTLRGVDPTDGSVVSFSFNPGGTMAQVRVFFSNTYSITASTILNDGSNLNQSGLVTPWGSNGVYNATQGDSAAYTFNETLRYHIQDVTIDEVSQGIIENYTFYDVQGPHTIVVTYADCGPVTNMQVSQVAGTSALITWEGAPTFVDYTLAYREAGESNTWDEITLSETSYLLGNLNENTNYEVRVKSNCSDELSGGWVTKTFHTRCLLGGDVEIGNGTSTSSYLPEYCYYNYAISEQIYLASELGGANTFHSIAFNASSVSTPSRNLDIYLMPTSATSINGFVALDATAKRVFSGNINLVTGWNTITFDSNFVYDGTSNLMVVVDNNTGDWGSSNSFYTHSANGLSVYDYDDYDNFNPYGGSYNLYTINYRNNVIFGGDCAEGNVCVAPNFYVSAVTESSADITWVPGNDETSWNLEYKVASDTEWTSLGSISGSSYTIEYLAPNTEYDVRMQSDCGSEQSAWRMDHFRTDCGIITELPYNEDFESGVISTNHGNYIVCWERLNNDESHFAYVDNGSNGHGGSGHYLDFHYTPNCYTIAIVPEIDVTTYDMTTLMAHFWLKRTNNTSTIFEVGIMTDKDDASTFETVDTINLSTIGTYTEFTITFPDYSGNGSFIAFRASNGNSAGFMLDDLTIDVAPFCSSINELNVVDVAISSAMLSWVPGPLGTVSEYTVEYSIAGEDSWTSINGITDTTYLLSGLEPATDYDVRVISICEDGSEGDPLVEHFSTKCIAGGDVQIGEGTSTDNFVPVSNYYNYAISEQIYTAAELGGPNTFHSIAFQAATVNASTRNWNIYLMPTTESSLNSLTSITSEAQMVFSGTVNISQGWFTIPFTTDYVYDGQTNLMLIVDDNTGSYVSANSYYTHTNPNGNVVKNYSDYTNYDPSNVSGGSTQNKRNNVIFGGECDEDATCAMPSLFVGTVTDNSAEVYWAAGYQESAWDLEYKPANDTAWIALGTIQDLDYTIDNLIADTKYDVRLRSNCGDEFSGWSIAHFRTDCGIISVATNPWTCDFEGTNEELLSCWTSPVQSTYSNRTFPNIEHTASIAHASSAALEIAFGNVLTALPQFEEEISTLQISFWSYHNTAGSDALMELGYITDTEDPSSFVPVDTINYTSYTQYIKQFSDLADLNLPASTRIAFRYTAASSNLRSYYLDDFEVSLIPDCMYPTNLHIVNALEDGATIAWDELGSADAWNVAYGAVGFNPEESENIVLASTNPFTLTGLESITRYDVYVQSNCGTSTSTWTGPVTFLTSTYTMGTSGSDTLTTCGTVIYDNGGANNNYTSNINYTLVIYPATPDAMMMLSGTYFSAESTNYDKLEVFDGVGTSGTLLATLGGNSTQNNIRILSTTGPLTLHFVTDGYGNYAGFELFATCENCFPPSNITASNVTTNSADLAWSSGSGEYSICVMGPDTTYYSVSDTTLVLNDLIPASTYNVTIRSICGDDSSFVSQTYTFNTECDAITITEDNPWTEDFDSYSGSGVQPFVCWETPVTASVDNGVAPFVYCNYTQSCHSGANSAELKGNSNMLVLPPFSNDIHELRLSFWATATSINTGTLEVGVITTVNDPSTFELVGETGRPGPRGNSGTVSGNGAFMGYYDFNGVSVPSGRIALRYTDNTASFYSAASWNLDDFVVELGPSCPSPAKNSVTATNIGGRTAVISWVDNDATHNSWTVYYKESTVNTWSNVIASTQSVQLTNLTPETAYDVYVVTNCAVMDDPVDSTNTITFTTTVACPAPTNLAANVTSTDVTITWNGTADAYVLEYGPSGFTPGTGTTISNITTTSQVLTGLLPSTNYTVFVTSDCGSDGQSSNASISFATMCETFDVPFSESFNGISSGIPLCWDNSEGTTTSDSYKWNYYGTGYEGSCIRFDSYFNSTGKTNILKTPAIDLTSGDTLSFYVKNPAGGDLTVSILDGTGTPHVLESGLTGISDWILKEYDLTPYDNQTVQITFHGTSNYGNGDAYIYLDNVNISAGGGTTVTDPTVTTGTATNITQTSATLRGTISNPDNVTITAQGFEWRVTLGGAYTPVNASGTDMTYNLNGLTANTGYTFRAFATTANSTYYGDEVIFTTLPEGVEPCNAPTNLTTADITANSVTLDWSQVGTPDSWTVRYKKADDLSWTDASTTTHPYIITNLEAETQYEAYVIAVCDENESDASNHVTFTTQPDGVNEYELSNTMLYPNPTTGMLTIRNEEVLISEVGVYDVYGKLLKSEKVDGNTAAIDLADLASGMYLVRIVSNEGAVITKSVVKR